MPWVYEAVGTAEWTGTPLRNLLEPAGLLDDVVEISFHGADRGFDRGTEHEFGRSLKPEVALSEDVLVVWAMNGAAAAAAARLSAAHGRARLVRHGEREVAQPHRGARQALSRATSRSAPTSIAPSSAAPATPVTHMRVKSLLIPPGVPDFYSRARITDRGRHTIHGRAWSGRGVPIARVEFGVDGAWQRRALDERQRQVRLARLERRLGGRARRARACLPCHGCRRQRAAARGALGRGGLRQQRRAACARQGEIGTPHDSHG